MYERRSALIKASNMSEEMHQDAADVAWQAVDRYNSEHQVASFIKTVSLLSHALNFINFFRNSAMATFANVQCFFFCRNLTRNIHVTAVHGRVLSGEPLAFA